MFFAFSLSVSGLETVIGRYGETLEIPCNKGAFKPEDVFMTKWKYVSQRGGLWIQNGEVCLTPTYHVWATPSLSAHAVRQTVHLSLRTTLHEQNAARFLFELGASAACDRRATTSALCFVPQDKGEGLQGDLLVKQKDMVNIASEEYKGRVSLADNSSLLLSEAKLSDQGTFTCMVVSGTDIPEYPVNVLIYSECKPAKT